MSLSQETRTPTDLPPSPPPEANGSPHPAPFPAAGTNGQPRSLPSARRRRRWLLPVAVFLGLMLAGGAVAVFFAVRPAAARPDVLLYKVKREDLDVTVTEKGTLESASNMDLVCKVRAGSKGGSGGFATSINWVIDDGSKVKKDHLLMVLDDSALQDQFRDQKIKVDQALAAKITAEKQYEINIKEGERAVAEAANALTVAKLELEKFVGLSFDPDRVPVAAAAGTAAALTEGGDYKRQVDDATGQVRLAESNVEQYREIASWADRMVKMKYMSPAQAQAQHSKLDSELERLRSLQSQRGLLLQYDRKKLLADFKSKVENARLKYDKEVLTAESNLASSDIDRKTKTSIYNQELEKLHDLEEQIRECKIRAPQDGMVVYFKNENSRFGSQPSNMIEQGAQVKEGQKLLRIPNLERMQVNTKVHEAMYARIQGDVRIATNIVEHMQTGLLANLDPFARVVSQKEDVMQHVRELYRQYEYRPARKGQPATVRVDAMADVLLHGRVRSIAQVASQADSWMSDVKLYPTIVLIDEKVDGLKPDMSAEVNIHVKDITNVLTIPLQSVIGGAELGGKRKVFVKTPTGFEEKEVSLGLYNEKMVEVREGLAEGDEVVINPKVLLGDNKQKTRDGAGSGGDEGGGKGKGFGGEGGGTGGKKGGFDPAKRKGGGGFKGKGQTAPGGEGPAG